MDVPLLKMIDKRYCYAINNGVLFSLTHRLDAKIDDGRGDIEVVSIP